MLPKLSVKEGINIEVQSGTEYVVENGTKCTICRDKTNAAIYCKAKINDIFGTYIFPVCKRHKEKSYTTARATEVFRIYKPKEVRIIFLSYVCSLKM